MSATILRVEIVSPTLAEVTAPQHELGSLAEYLSENGLLAMRQADCVVVEGCWRSVLKTVAGFDGDPWLGSVYAEEAASA